MIKCIKALAFRRPIGLFTDTTTVNKYGEITVDRERFVLRKTNVKQVIVIKRMGSIYMFYF